MTDISADESSRPGATGASDATSTIAAAVRDLADSARTRLDGETADGFVRRTVDRLDDITRIAERLYGADSNVPALVHDLLLVALDALVDRPAALRELDRARVAEPAWFLRPDQIGYVCYVDRFAGQLDAVAAHLPYLDELGVRYLHLMPLLRTRDGEDDGGYAVSDYDAVHPSLGHMADLTALADAAHERGLALCVDLAINHTAREHEWAQRAMRGEQHFRDFYLIFPDRTMPDEYERTAPDIFPELSPGSFTFVPELGSWVWTTFREFQWDLNYANPAVFKAMLETMLRLANRGPDILRIDAAPFLGKRVGTTCMDQPETHLLLQLFRALTFIAAPGLLLKAEAMLEPDAVLTYLGTPDGPPECDLAYDNQLMVMLWASFATGDARLARHALGRRRAPRDGTSWVTYVRCHDDIGWAIDDADAAAVGDDGRELRARISDFYAGAVPGSFADGVRFQQNPAGAHPICGTTASLCGVGTALRSGDAEALDVALRRLETMYSIAYSHGGIPLLYMGDELALCNDPHWDAEARRAGDNRWLHRPRMDWQLAARRPDTSAVAGSTFAALQRLGRARAATSALDAAQPLRMHDFGASVLGYSRGEPGEFVAVANVTASPVTVDADLLRAAGIDDPEPIACSDGVAGFTLPAAGYAWWRQRGRPAAVSPRSDRRSRS